MTPYSSGRYGTRFSMWQAKKTSTFVCAIRMLEGKSTTSSYLPVLESLILSVPRSNHNMCIWCYTSCERLITKENMTSWSAATRTVTRMTIHPAVTNGRPNTLRLDCDRPSGGVSPSQRPDWAPYSSAKSCLEAVNVVAHKIKERGGQRFYIRTHNIDEEEDGARPWMATSNYCCSTQDRRQNAVQKPN